MPEVKEPLLNYWYRALSSHDGIEISCSDPDRTKQQLYQARAAVHDSDLNQVSICISPFDPMKLWLVRKKPNETAGR